MYLLQSPLPHQIQYFEDLGNFLLINCLIYVTYRSVLPNSTKGWLPHSGCYFQPVNRNTQGTILHDIYDRGAEKGWSLLKILCFVFWAKRREKLRGNSLADFDIGRLALSSEEQGHFAPSVRIFDTEKGILRLARPLFNNHRSGETSRSRVMGRGDIEFHFSAICQGMKSILGGREEQEQLETTANHNIDGRV